jgi:hypothetical protein
LNLKSNFIKFCQYKRFCLSLNHDSNWPKTLLVCKETIKKAHPSGCM